MTAPDYVYVTVIHAPPERVWEALTSAEFTARYWHRTRVHSDFAEGSRIEFLVDDGRVGCEGEILSVDPPRELSYTWRFPGNPDVRDEAPSRVTFFLEALGSEDDRSTRLTVRHDAFPEGSRMPGLVGPGWPLVISGLKTLLETGVAVDFTAMA